MRSRAAAAVLHQAWRRRPASPRVPAWREAAPRLACEGRPGTDRLGSVGRRTTSCTPSSASTAHGIGDPARRFRWDILRAMKGANLWPVVLETSVAFSVHAGPWDSAAFHRTLKGCAKHFFEHVGCGNDLFCALFEQMCLDFGEGGARTSPASST